MKAPAPRRGPAALLAVVVVGACGIFHDDAPDSARVLVEGAAGHPIELITSSDFDAVTRPDGDGREITVFAADTTTTRTPLDVRFGLGPRTRIYVIVRSDSTAVSPVRVRIYVDEDLRFDSATRFADGEYAEFVFASAGN